MAGPQITVTAAGLDGLLNRLKRARGRITGETAAAIDEALRAAQATVRSGTPVRTGRARQGWYLQRPAPLEGILINPVPYVPFLVHGTYKMHPSRALNEALDRAAADARRTVERAGVRIAAALARG